MNINELIEHLGKLKDEHGSLEVYCINDDGYGGLYGQSELTEEYIHVRRPDTYKRCMAKHLIIGEG